MNKIIIMGATSGIGFLVAQRMAEKGWKVGACGRNVASLNALKSDYPDNIFTAQIDITREKATERLTALINEMGVWTSTSMCREWGMIILNSRKIRR